ncbi:hypothetical protein BF17_00130 (plasmid) [Yersinia similis]|uniref:Uncharacterized protein n=1 Tax=Yersinia similis TaxID=367190 RepID=A0ABM5Q454_9GAMM|nr:hypothetical protein [Yersinia similis]AHK22118.1 hypothetical protein BF17_00130 [Yersinia similis]CFQ66843.1 Uncharacterised protein [Yersinia similis]CNB81705.1 Uncharacterised protein [Yersinia similis]
MDDAIVLSAIYLTMGARDQREDFNHATQCLQISEMELLSAFIPHAEAVETVAEYLTSAGYEFQGVWLYEVVEPFGAELIKFHDIPYDGLAADVLAGLLCVWLGIDQDEKSAFIDTVKYHYLKTC